MLINGYVYTHKHDTGEEIIDTWGVVVADEKGECYLCPDISVDRYEAEEFAKIAVQNNIAPEKLCDAADDYIEAHSCIVIRSFASF